MNRARTVKILTTVLIIVIVVLLAVGAGFYVIFQNLQKEKDRANDMEAMLNANKQYVYVALSDLTKGTKIEEGVNVSIEENVTSLPASMYVQKEDLGKILLVNVKAYEPVMSSMVTDELFENDTREVEVAVANLMLDQKINDYVDIRVLFPDGSDYLVVPKLKVKKMSLENNIFYANLSEDEILTLSAVTIDAYTITGTRIYITRYVEPGLQEDGIPNYPVRQETLLLMSQDPNILKRAEKTLNLEARQLLESRLAMLSEDQLQSVSEGFGLANTAHNTAYVTNQQETVTVFDEENEIIEDTNN